MDQLHAMKVFVRVAETGGFAEAARNLNMSPPAVTRAVSALEDAIGARLLTRTTRSVQMTDAGHRYLEDCRRILADIKEADAAASGIYATPTGMLTVTASVLFGQIYVLPIITEFLDTYPDVSARLLFLDRVTNIVDEGIDVSIRIGHLPDSSHAAIKVGTVRRVVCASPAYLETRGVPRTPADLAEHTIIAGTSAFASLDWRFGQEDKRSSVQVRPTLYCNTYAGVIEAARLDWGLARVLSYQIGPCLEEGSLLTVLEDYEEEPLPIHIIHPEGRKASAKVRSFVDFAAERLRANRLIN